MTITMATEVSGSSCAKLEGYLYKRGQGKTVLGRKNWKKRYFVLDQGKLCYYENQESYNNGAPPFGILHLSQKDTVSVLAKSNSLRAKDYSFLLTCVNSERQISLAALTVGQMEDWMTSIQRHSESNFAVKSTLKSGFPPGMIL